MVHNLNDLMQVGKKLVNIMQNFQKYFAILLTVLMTGLLPAQQWQYKTAMPTARKGMAIAVMQDKIWVMGGSQMGHHALTTVEVYDPLSDTWNDQVPQLNLARDNATAQVWNDKIYIFGGAHGSELVSPVEMYDPSAGSWQIISQLPTQRLGMASVSTDSSIWLIGGANSQGNFYPTVEKYFPATNSWDTLSPGLNIARGEPMAARINGEIFVFGGYFFSPVSNYEKFNRDTGIWELMGQMPYNCASAGYAVTGNRGWLIGGRGQNGVFDTVQIFRFLSGEVSWQEGPPLATPRRELAAAAVQDKLYAIGGRGNMGPTIYDTVEELDILVGIEPPSPAISRQYCLLENFPNPFNPSTTIRLYLPAADNVRLKIFDPLGREITELFKGHLSAGTHEFSFSVSDISGIKLSSGLYFLRLEGRKFNESHKIYLMK